MNNRLKKIQGSIYRYSDDTRTIYLTMSNYSKL